MIVGIIILALGLLLQYIYGKVTNDFTKSFPLEEFGIGATIVGCIVTVLSILSFFIATNDYGNLEAYFNDVETVYVQTEKKIDSLMDHADGSIKIDGLANIDVPLEVVGQSQAATKAIMKLTTNREVYYRNLYSYQRLADNWFTGLFLPKFPETLRKHTK